ncbi:HAMP domain-containing sensor histidine kinase [Luedemannella flava]|uniref:histidine kinase n=1 Tax=Luedemannella flava TaxID=349316 RepID=A0ABP4Y4V3_9ACTN
MRPLRLRTRVTVGFAAGALLISAAMAVLSYDLTRRTLLDSRERTAVRTAYFDATVVQAGLAADGEPGDVLRALDTGASRRVAIQRWGTWYLRNADNGITAAIPAGLRQQVTDGQPSRQLVRTDNGAALVVGVPLTDGSQFYVIDSLSELDRTLSVLGLILTIVAFVTTACGAVVGTYLARRALRPLTSVADAARTITAGDLTTRLDPAATPDLERLTSSFNGMVDQLAERLERDRRFAADVSHELRSPLQTLAAATSVLTRRRDQLDDRSARAVQLVAEEVDRFQALVTDLLELARSDQRPDRAPVDIAALARRSCADRGLPPTIVRDLPGADHVWHVDERRFTQVLANLLDNAERHGGGAVAVVVGGDDRLATLDVDDEGPGVPPTDRDSIFGRFVRGRGANARGDSDGTGLGLALVAQHVSAHGGHVTALDRPGGGARFRVELPRDRS